MTKVIVSQYGLLPPVLHRRLDFYRNEAKMIAEKYSRIVLDKMDLRLLAKLENSQGMPTDVNEKARKNVG